MKKKIFVFNNGGHHNMLMAMALAEDGHVVGQHCCSSEGFMKGDMGITSTWKHDQYNEHFGVDGWELEWVETCNLETHEGLTAARKLNEELAEEKRQEDHEKTRAGATITMDDGEEIHVP